MLKITLGSGVPSSFDLGILHQDSDHTDLIVTLYSSTGTVLSTADATGGPTSNAAGANDFYYTDVSGATSGDYLVVGGSISSYQVTVGGVTFDTPEPSTYALMLAGLGALLLVARLRRKDSKSS